MSAATEETKMPETDQLVSEAAAPGGSEEILLDADATEALATKIGPALFESGATDEEPEPKPKEELVDGDDGEEPESEDEPKEKEEDAPAEGEPAKKGEGKDGDEEAVPAKAGPTLPAAYRRSLLARQWTNEEIDVFWNADPEKALDRFEKVHIERNQENAEFARLGREAQAATAAAGQAPVQEAVAAPAAVLAGGMARIDTEALVQHFGGNEELVNGIVGPVNAAIDQINSFLPELRGGVASIQAANNAALKTQIDAFFSSDDLKPYTELYGDPAKGRTSQQTEKWAEVLELADATRAGAESQGRQISPEVALADAHASVSSGFQAEAIRKELKSKVEKRGAAVSPKPRTRGKTGAKNNTREGLVSRVASALPEALGD